MTAYAHEAAAAVMQKASADPSIGDVYSRVAKGNQPSRRLADKLGMRLFVYTQAPPILHPIDQNV